MNGHGFAASDTVMKWPGGISNSISTAPNYSGVLEQTPVISTLEIADWVDAATILSSLIPHFWAVSDTSWWFVTQPARETGC